MRNSYIHRRSAMVLVITGGLTLWAFSPEVKAAQRKGILSGVVRSVSGAVLGTGVVLRLELENGDLVDQRLGGSDGRFEFDGVTNTLYRLRVTAPGFQTLEKEVDLNGPQYSFFVEIVLIPLASYSSPPTNLPSLTDAITPRKARKEYEKGRRALSDKKPDEAKGHFEKAIQVYPCYSRALTDLAVVHITQSKALPAEAALRKSIACDADYLEAYLRLGMLLNSGHRFAEGQKTLEEGLRRAPNDWELHYELAASLSGLEQYQQSEGEYLKVRSLNPVPPPELHVKLADLLYRMKEFDKAYQEMQAYLVESPEGRFAARTRTVIQQMEGSGLVHAVPGQVPQTHRQNL